MKVVGSRTRTPSFASLGLGFALLLLASCGGDGGAQADAKSPHDHDRPAAHRAPDRAPESEADEGADAPSGPRCDDGTCSPCGASMCPSGWYCDESVAGGAACSWLKECAAKPSCGCVTKVLGAACKCHEEAGGLKVSCG